MLNIFKKPYNINIPSSILLKKSHTSKTKKKKQMTLDNCNVSGKIRFWNAQGALIPA